MTKSLSEIPKRRVSQTGLTLERQALCALCGGRAMRRAVRPRPRCSAELAGRGRPQGHSAPHVLHSLRSSALDIARPRATGTTLPGHRDSRSRSWRIGSLTRRCDLAAPEVIDSASYREQMAICHIEETG